MSWPYIIAVNLCPYSFKYSSRFLYEKTLLPLVTVTEWNISVAPLNSNDAHISQSHLVVKMESATTVLHQEILLRKCNRKIFTPRFNQKASQKQNQRTNYKLVFVSSLWFNNSYKATSLQQLLLAHTTIKVIYFKTYLQQLCLLLLVSQ